MDAAARMSWVVLVLLCGGGALVSNVGCVRSQAVECEFGTCAAGLACDEVHRECVYPEQLTYCLEMPDASSCEIGGMPLGVCKDEICVRERCGDELVTGAEVCDGATDIPEISTCVDFAFDYGTLGCTEICGQSTSTCHRLGWTFRAVPGTGTVQAVAQDGDTLYMVQRGQLYRFDGTTWSEPDPITVGFESIYSLWVFGGEVFAAGLKGPFAGATGFLLHYDGTSWTKLEVTPRMWSVFGTGTSDVYAVGDAGTIYHFANGAWTQMVSNVTEHLYGVWAAAGTAVAVGGTGTFLVRTGSTWSPISGASTFDLRGVWGSSPTSVDAVGTGGEIYHFDGAQLSGTQVSGAPLASISGRSTSEIYAVGARGMILVGDGTSWTQMESSTTANLQTVFAGTNRIFAAESAEYFLEYAGAAWVTPSQPSPAGEFYAITGRGGGNLIVAGRYCAIHEYGAGGWTDRTPSGCGTNTLFGVWTAPDNADAYAVGMNGLLVERKAGSWAVASTSPVQASAGLMSVWGSSHADVFVAGGDFNTETAALAHFDGVSWQDWSSRVPSLGPIRGVWGSGPTDVFFAGDHGHIAHYDGSTIVDVYVGPGSTTFSAVWGSSGTDVFAVGDGGRIVHYDGTTWIDMTAPVGLTVPTTPTWTAVTGSGPADVFATGGRTLLHYDGNGWAPVNRPVSGPAFGIHQTNDQLYVVGEFGLGPRLTGKLSR